MSTLFAPGTVGPARRDGRELWLAYEIALRAGDRLHLLFERWTTAPRQGLALACVNRRHRIGCAGQAGNRFTLWTDTAPKHVEIEYLLRRGRGAVSLMNVWQFRDYGPTVFRGVNAACMAVSSLGDNEWLFECSDGYGLEPPCLDDLVVRVIRESAA
jgi:hypothetical protein